MDFAYFSILPAIGVDKIFPSVLAAFWGIFDRMTNAKYF